MANEQTAQGGSDSPAAQAQISPAQPATPTQTNGGFFSFNWLGNAAKAVGDFVGDVKNKVDIFLISNPVIKNTLDGVFNAGISAGVGYGLGILVPGAQAVFTIAGLVGAVRAGVTAYATHQLDTAHITNITQLATNDRFQQNISNAITQQLVAVLKGNQVAASVTAAPQPSTASVKPAPSAPAPVLSTVPPTPTSKSGVQI